MPSPLPTQIILSRMTKEETEIHYDNTKHVRLDQFGDIYYCKECDEINSAWGGISYATTL